jgi:hypothetical protein
MGRVIGWSPIECPYNNWWLGFHDGSINHGKYTVEASAEEIALALSPKLGGDKAKANGGIVWIWKIAWGKGKQAMYPHSSDTYICTVRNTVQRREMTFAYATAT